MDNKDKNPFYKTNLGKLWLANSVDLIKKYLGIFYKNKVQLIITSPPFPLNSKKKYGNLNGKSYKKWFSQLAFLFENLIKENGSIVIEIGNAWEFSRPVQSTLPIECLLELTKYQNIRLIQEFVCYNPSRLPSPAIWVNRQRIRTVDSYTHVWWLAKSDNPKADNRKILRPYSKGMKNLLKRGAFNSGKRPSGHKISRTAFLKDNQGSISHNLLELERIEEGRENRLPHNILSLANTSSSDFFSKTCKKRGILRHPATMHPSLIAFFTHFLTDEEDLILDPFAGSNTTGYIAESLNRKWIGIEILEEYARQSAIRFEDPKLKTKIKFRDN